MISATRRRIRSHIVADLPSQSGRAKIYSPFAAAVLGLLTALTVGGDARGGFLITYSNLNIAAGSVATVNVQISSDASSDTPDNLDLFSLHLILAPTDATGSISFVSQQSENHLAPGSLNDDYVFKGDSLGESSHASSENISTVSTTNLANDTLDLLDATLSFGGVYLSMGNGMSLLFQVNLDTRSANAGDTFTIRLIDDERTSLSESPNLTSNSGHALVLNGASFNASTLKVVATPEPSSAVLFLLCGPAYYAYTRRRKGSELQRRPKPA